MMQRVMVQNQFKSTWSPGMPVPGDTQPDGSPDFRDHRNREAFMVVVRPGRPQFRGTVEERRNWYNRLSELDTRIAAFRRFDYKNPVIPGVHGLAKAMAERDRLLYLLGWGSEYRSWNH